jgi:hypothetical protein
VKYAKKNSNNYWRKTMTNRIHSLTVVLDKDYRDDDIKAISNTIRMIKGVIDVQEHVADINSRMAESRALCEMREKLLNIFYPGNEK